MWAPKSRQRARQTEATNSLLGIEAPRGVWGGGNSSKWGGGYGLWGAAMVVWDLFHPLG